MAEEHLIADIEGDVQAYLEDLGVKLDKELVAALVQASTHAEGELKQAISDLCDSGGTGELSRNPKAKLLQTEGAVKSAGAFLDLIYARIQDEGDTITAKRVKNLPVPLTSEAKVPGKSPRMWSPGRLFFIKSKRGNNLLVERRGAKLKPHYVLKRSVQIRGKGYVERARRAAESVIAEIMADHAGIAIINASMPKG